MIESFGVAETDIAFWAGIISAVTSFAQCLTAVPWGRFSDRYGRKPAVLLGLACTMWTSLLWGFSTNLPTAIVARAFQGGMNGNVGIMRTMVAEMCPWKDLQPRAFSILPLVWNLGSVLGPAMGGALSNPYNKKPGDNSSGSLLWTFPYALPNLVVIAFFFVGITTGVLYLDETLASRRGQKDYGKVLGKRLSQSVSNALAKFRRTRKQPGDREAEPLLHGNLSHHHNSQADEEAALLQPDAETSKHQKSASIREVLTKQTVLNLVVYTFLAMHAVAYDQVLSVFLHHSRVGKNVEKVELPFRFNRGFGLRSSEIGLYFTLYAVISIFCQFVIFPSVARAYGVLKCLRAVLIIMPIVYFFTPFTTVIDDLFTAEVALFFLLAVKGFCNTFAFPCTTILLTNSASSIRVLATINGIATSVSAVGRGVGPLLAGSVFSWGVKNGYIITPFWTLTAIGVVGSAASFLLVEEQGFGDDGETDSENMTDDDDDNEDAAKSTADDDDELDQPEVQGGHRINVEPPLARDWTNSIASEAVSEAEEDPREAAPIFGSLPGFYGMFGEPDSGSAQGGPKSRHRRSSAPIGMGSGFRRLSSNLGQTRSGYGSGGGLA